MIFLFDANAVSDFMNEHARVDERLAGLAPDDIVLTSVVARGEILYGIERLPAGRRREILASKAATALRFLRAEPLPVSAAEHYARMKVACERNGTELEDNDLWIAAAALSIGAIVVSRDLDLSRIDGLRVEDWTA